VFLNGLCKTPVHIVVPICCGFVLETKHVPEKSRQGKKFQEMRFLNLFAIGACLGVSEDGTPVENRWWQHI
jgi:hypothetical protein